MQNYVSASLGIIWSSVCTDTMTDTSKTSTAAEYFLYAINADNFSIKYNSYGLPVVKTLPFSAGSTDTQMALVVRNLPANEGDSRESGSAPGLGRCPGGGNSNPLQYSPWETHMDRGDWQATDSPLDHKDSDMTESLSNNWIQ